MAPGYKQQYVFCRGNVIHLKSDEVAMENLFSKSELKAILQSLRYAKLYISEQRETPSEVRAANISNIEHLVEKVALMLKQATY
jgi:hypothetical protein